MEKEEKKQRATAELAKEYDELMARMETIDENDTSDETGKFYDRLDELQSNYDWDNYAFTDPKTGKKGVKDITGRILIPARYDKADLPRFLPLPPHSAAGGGQGWHVWYSGCRWIWQGTLGIQIHYTCHRLVHRLILGHLG